MSDENRKYRAYFGYGSNMWLNQMNRRCPESTFIGIGFLRDWKWFICTRGYANIIESPGDIVYGFVFKVTESDEASLDGYEEVPVSYVKQTHQVELVGQHEGEVKDALVYVDIVRVLVGNPKAEYVERMNCAIRDAEEKGIPEDYIEKTLRRFIPLIQN
jgi:gamma-glutamylcyclotransferase